eukprot:72157-Rhodomonas_salina.2
MSGSAITCAAACVSRYAVSVSNIACAAVGLRAFYAVSGTELPYAPTSVISAPLTLAHALCARYQPQTRGKNTPAPLCSYEKKNKYKCTIPAKLLRCKMCLLRYATAEMLGTNKAYASTAKAGTDLDFATRVT